MIVFADESKSCIHFLVMCTAHLLMYSLGVVLLTDKYAEIEKQLIDNFRRAYYDGDLQRMKNITTILSNFKVNLRFY